MAHKAIPDLFRVKPHSKVRLRDFNPAWTGTKEMRKLGTGTLKKEAHEFIQQNLQRLTAAQELLWASDKYALLVVLQAMDAAGKDGVIKHVMSGVNPQGCQVFGFKRPSEEDLEHDFLWRYSKCLPARGRIGIFNRSYYEDVLVVRVHPEWLEREKLATSKRGAALWKNRYEDINQFEEHLARNGTAILKFFLHVSKKEQKRRLLARLDNHDKRWKFSEADLAERAHWHEYVEAYEAALSSTSTAHAPWYILPADYKWVPRWLVSEILTKTIQRLGLKIPEPTKEREAALAKARRLLERE
jgi:PPK2 family polyphosphate:nucleotide phosphotransferase